MAEIKHRGFSVNSSNQVLFDGNLVELKPKTAALFVLLLQRKGRVMPREEIISTFWPNDPTADDGLSKAIHEIRKILKDTGPEETISLETIYKVGYRLVSASDNPSSNTKPVKTRKVLFRRVLFFLLLTIVTIVVTLIIFFSLKSR